MRCQKGFTLIEVLVAGAIGIVFVGVSWEILQLSYHTMQVSHIVADEQDLRVAIAESLGGSNGEYCKENLVPTSDSTIGRDWDASDEIFTSIGELKRKGTILVKEGEIFKQALDIKKMELIAPTGVTDKPSGSNAVGRKFVLTYRGKGENKDRTLTCTLDYQITTSNTASVCNLVNCDTSEKSGVWDQVCYYADPAATATTFGVTSGGKVLIGCGTVSDPPSSSDNATYKVPPNSSMGTTAIGYEAGTGYGTGSNRGKLNTYIGFQAGHEASTGTGTDEVVAVGFKAGYKAKNQSVYIGSLAGVEGGGFWNVYIGRSAGQRAKNKKNIVAIGSMAGLQNGVGAGTSSEGIGNTFVGALAGQKNTTGSHNTILGFGGTGSPESGGTTNLCSIGDCLTGSNNTFLGFQTGVRTKTGAHNTFIGSEAGYDNQTGIQNTYIGYRAGKLSTEKDNTFIGSYAGMKAKGEGNTFVGKGAGVGDLGDNTADYNVFVGWQAGYVNTTGEYNTFIGSEAGTKNTTARKNTFIGYLAGSQNITSENNTFIGYHAGSSHNGGNGFNTFIGSGAGRNNTIAQNNTFIGYNAGNKNTDKSSNTFIGHQAGRDNTADSNTFIGEKAGELHTTGGGNIYIGRGAGKGYGEGGSNIFIGMNSGAGDFTNFAAYKGNHNTFVGNLSGEKHKTGNDNTFIGYTAGQYNIDGIENTFIGYTAGQYNIDGIENTFIGGNAGRNNTSGRNNTFIGSSAGRKNTTGEYNTFVGFQAGGNASTIPVSAGNKNVFIGYLAGYNNTADNTIIIKAGTGANQKLESTCTTNCPPLAKLKNLFKRKKNEVTPNGGNIIIGSFDLEKQKELTANNNYLWIGDLIEGNTKEKWVHIKNRVETKTLVASVSTGSDKKFKKVVDKMLARKLIPSNIDFSPTSKKVFELTPVSWFWKDKSMGKGKQFGFIAQDMQKVIPEIVGKAREGLTIKYWQLIPFIVGALQELTEWVSVSFNNMAIRMNEISKVVAEQFTKIKELKKLVTENATGIAKLANMFDTVLKNIDGIFDKLKGHSKLIKAQDKNLLSLNEKLIKFEKSHLNNHERFINLLKKFDKKLAEKDKEIQLLKTANTKLAKANTKLEKTTAKLFRQVQALEKQKEK